MIYRQVFEHYGKKEVINCGVIGAGYYNTGLIAQELGTTHMHICIVADKKAETAYKAYLTAGIPPEQIVFCTDADDASAAITAGLYVYTDDAELIMELQEVDVVAEGTGDSEAACRYCLSAINHGKHVVAITKGMDSAVGPILKKLADDKNLIYTQADGDQPALLIAMVEWARLAGLKVLSAGKARDGEYLLDEAHNRVYLIADEICHRENVSVSVAPEDMKYLGMIPDGCVEEYVNKRADILNGLPKTGDYDLCELTIMANATGLKPPSPRTTRATLRITELPVAYCPESEGGLYKEEGIVDVHTNLRRPDESGMGGGMYLVVKADNPYAQHILATKGQIANYRNSAVVLYRPWHLCGVETNVSVMCAGLIGASTGATQYLPRYDLVKSAVVDIKKGECFRGDRDERMQASIVPATCMSPDAPVPAHMLNGNTASRDIKAGELITYSMIVKPEQSTLWELRKLQEETFGRKSAPSAVQ